MIQACRLITRSVVVEQPTPCGIILPNRNPHFPRFSPPQSVKILGDKLVELQLTRGSVSEVLRIFLESHGYDTDVCNTMRTKTFHSLPPDTKAAILSFLVDELNGSNIVTK